MSTISERLLERHRIDSERMWPAPSDLDLLAAEHIKALEWALRFYANPGRYDGPNMPPLPDDPFQPEHLVYRMDVTRDFGSVARAALQPKEPK